MMNTKRRAHKGSAEKTVRDNRRATRRHYSEEDENPYCIRGSTQ